VIITDVMHIILTLQASENRFTSTLRRYFCGTALESVFCFSLGLTWGQCCHV